METHKVMRQGDLNFKLVVGLSIKENPLNKKNEYVLSVGELHNHEHKIKTLTKEDIVKVYEGKNGEMIIEVKGKAVLTHPEHKTLEFTTGTYKMHKEREYDYWALETRKVVD